MTLETLFFKRKRALFASLLLALAPALSLAADQAPRDFDIASDVAAKSLKIFAQQSGIEVLISGDEGQAVRTQAIKGRMLPDDAIDAMFANTGLEAKLDEKSGVYVVKKGGAPDPNAQRVAAEVSSHPTEAALNSGTGRVSGTIQDALTGVLLPNAEVKIRGTNLQTVSQRFGVFSFDHVPAGQIALVVTCSGMQTTETDVVVGSGQTSSVTVTMQSEVLKLAPYKVEAGLETGTALALNMEEESVNQMTVMDSAAFGPIAQENIGDFLRMLPGVTSQIDNVTIDKLQIRGLPEQETVIMQDGTKIANTNSSFSDSQRIDTIPAEDVGLAEVIYAPTPDMDADSLGGIINLETKSGWDLDHRVIDFSASANYSLTFKDHVSWQSEKSVTPNFNFAYGDRYSVLGGTNNLGIYFDANSDEFYTSRTHFKENYNSNWVLGTPVLGNFDEYADEAYDFTRNSGDLRIDYRSQTGDQYHITTGAARYRYFQGTPTEGFESKKGTVQPASTTDLWIVNGAQYDGSEELDNNISTSGQVHFWAEHKRGAWKLDYDFDYSKSRWYDNRLQLDLLSGNQINYTLDRTNATSPVFTQTSGVPLLTDNFTNVSSSTFDNFDNAFYSAITGGKVDLARSFNEDTNPINLKVGYRYLRENRSEDANEFIAAGATNTSWPTYLDTAQMDRTGTLYTKSFPIAPIARADVFASAAGMKFLGGSNPLTAWQYNPAVVVPNTSKILSGSLGNTGSVERVVNAAYVQSDITFGKLNILGGVRFENTDISGAGISQSSLTSTTAYAAAPASDTYTNWFPSIHLRYKPIDNLVFRASYNTTIGRPDTSTILPSVNQASNGIVTFSNPGLSPELGRNIDVRSEYYFKPSGIVAVGVFEQRISNFIVNDTGIIGQNGFPTNGLNLSSYTGDQGMTSINGGSATTRGVDVAYNQFFKFLPGYLSGLGTFFNYTWLEPNGYFGAATPYDDAPDFRKQSGNVGVSWIYGRWDLRVNVNHISKYLYSISTSDPSSTEYKLPVTNWNVFVKCRLNRQLQVFFNLINVTRNEQVETKGVPSDYRLDENDVLAVWATAGVKMSF